MIIEKTPELLSLIKLHFKDKELESKHDLLDVIWEQGWEENDPKDFVLALFSQFISLDEFETFNEQETFGFCYNQVSNKIFLSIEIYYLGDINDMSGEELPIHLVLHAEQLSDDEVIAFLTEQNKELKQTISELSSKLETIRELFNTIDTNSTSTNLKTTK